MSLLIEYMHFIAITKEHDEPQKLSLPIEMAETINEQFKNFPDGVPVTTGKRTMTVQALIIGTQSFWKKPLMLVPNNGEED
ncbi:hypothetical protein [Jeotgalicoccus halotolerans]|uniref:Uncharacterized protein n=1 Tax=Jeotgalicoccus halotolerans TaxID=157227 RepID=A0A3E0AZW8_9STAP|nr:hypothetical protein [Jeotgalicoccus halotolerans]REG25266.1 hypothetical protein DFR63_0292 [Jeotgalicoccus halotolerans]